MGSMENAWTRWSERGGSTSKLIDKAVPGSAVPAFMSAIYLGQATNDGPSDSIPIPILSPKVFRIHWADQRSIRDAAGPMQRKINDVVHSV